MAVGRSLSPCGPGVIGRPVEACAAHVKPPTLVGILKTLEHPRTWPTRSHALWLAGRLSVAAHLVREFLRDAEITGSEGTADTARQWLESLGVEAPEAVDMMALAPKRAVQPSEEFAQRGAILFHRATDMFGVRQTFAGFGQRRRV